METTYKLLVNAPDGTQRIEEVTETGGYFDAERVLWDERTQGPLEDVVLGAMVLVNGALVVDLAKADTAAATKLAAEQAAVWEAIKTRRDFLQDTGGYKVAGKWFHSDVKSRTQQIGLVMMGTNIPSGLMWKTMDGSKVSMTPALASQIFTAAATQDMTLFAVAEGHKAAMMASAHPATYDFSGGWPAIFTE